jgi:prepilin-type N-terminal cleavage/methylation domain-containing protein
VDGAFELSAGVLKSPLHHPRPECPAQTSEEMTDMTSKLARKARRGFTLVEIMIVVLIIGILLAIAVPNFVKARESSRAKSCVANLKQIESAKEQWAMDSKAAPSDTPADTDLYGTDKYIKTTPACPSNGSYTVGAMSARPTCSRPTTEGHVLP